MSKNTFSRVATFVALSYTLAFVIDIIALRSGLAASLRTGTTPIVWGFARMWSVALSAVVCLVIYREGVAANLKRFLTVSRGVVKYYLIAPLIVYGALALYIAIALPLGFFNFNAYVETIVDTLRSAMPSSVSEEQITSIATVAAYVQIFSGYIAAITINAFYALGEEIGWRGYLYSTLGSRPSLRNTIIIGVLWGFWHTSAIVLLGFQYTVTRYLGVVLFTLYTIALSYPHLLVTTTTGSVIPAASLHGAVNAIWYITVLASNLPEEQRELFLGLGLLGIVTWTILSTILYKATKTPSR